MRAVQYAQFGGPDAAHRAQPGPGRLRPRWAILEESRNGRLSTIIAIIALTIRLGLSRQESEWSIAQANGTKNILRRGPA